MAAILLPYNKSSTIYFPLVGSGTAAFTTAGSGSLIGTNVQISKDGGAFATSTNTGTVVGLGFYLLVLTTSECSAKQMLVSIKGSAGTIWEDQAVLIHTFGNASAMYPYDFGTALSAQTVGTVTTILGGTVGTVTSVVQADATLLKGTAISGTGGTLIVNLVANQSTATIGTVSFVATGSVNVTQILGTAASATAGVLNVNIIQLAGSSTAASQLARGAGNVGSGTATGTMNSTGFDSDLTEGAADHWKGRVVVFISGTLRFQASDVTGYTGSAVGTLSRVVITTLTTAPLAGDQFIIV